MSNLINILKTETETLKIQYVSMTKEWAGKDFERIESLSERYNASGSMKEMGTYNYYSAQKFLHRGGYSILQKGIEKYIEFAEKEAVAHYNQSIEKLAVRIEAKGLNQSEITVKTSHIEVNIDTVLTDGIKQVKAFTIIASGEIQRPHFRYLIR